MLGLLRTHKLTYESREDVGGGVVSLAFCSDAPLQRSRAGQHGILAVSATAMKPFTLASAPEEDRVLIGTSLESASAFKTRLAALGVGDSALLRGPINDFTLDGVTGEVVMLAQGVGVTPMRSMLAHVALTGGATTSTLLHVAGDGHAYRADTERWAGRATYLRHAQEFRAAAAAAAQERGGATFFIAGNTSFVSATAALLRDNGVPRGRIREDKYRFYRPHSRPGEPSSLVEVRAKRRSPPEMACRETR